jgi:O-antigen ligase
LLVFVWLGWQITRSERDIRWLAGGYVLGCSVAAALTWQAFLAGEWQAEFDQRYTAPGFDPNDLGVTLSIGIPIVAYLGLSGRSRWNYAWFAYFPLAVSAVVMSASRGASVTAVVALFSVVVALARRSVLAGIAMVGLTAATASFAWVLVPMETWTRILTIGEQVSGGTMSGRLPIWQAGLQILGRHPVLGVGAGGFADAASSILNYRIVGHNAFLSVSVELGAIGAVLFVFAVAWPLVCAVTGKGRDLAFVVSLLATWTVGVTSLSWEYRKTTWFVLLLAASVAALDRGARAARAASPTRVRPEVRSLAHHSRKAR